MKRPIWSYILKILDKAIASSSTTHDLMAIITITTIILIIISTFTFLLTIGGSTFFRNRYIFPTYNYEANLAGLGSYKLDDLQVGQMKFEYPVYLPPSSSEVVTLTITPGLGTRTDLPGIFQRVPIPEGTPLKLGEYYDYVSNILVAPELRATLELEGIKVSPLSNSPKQKMNSEGSNLWSWIILAPEQVGTHPLYLSIYLADNQEPIWSFSFTLSVTYSVQTPTPVPTATFTPIPTFTPTKTTGQQLKDNFVQAAPTVTTSILDLGGNVFSAIMLFIGTVLGTVLGIFIKSRLSPQPNNQSNPPRQQIQDPAGNTQTAEPPADDEANDT